MSVLVWKSVRLLLLTILTTLLMDFVAVAHTPLQPETLSSLKLSLYSCSFVFTEAKVIRRDIVRWGGIVYTTNFVCRECANAVPADHKSTVQKQVFHLLCDTG